MQVAQETFFLIGFNLFIWPRQVLVVALGIFNPHCNVQDL